jgi:hypothetical protein
VGEVVEATISLHRINLILRTSRQQLGLSSSLLIDNANIDALVTNTVKIGTGASTPLSTDPTNNEFADKTGGLTDLAKFGCIDYDDITAELKQRDTTCGPFRVWLLERNNESLTNIGASRNVWSGEVRGSGTNNELLVADVQAGTCEIELDDSTNFATVEATGADFVVIFADRNDANLTPCQENYGWIGDSDGLVQDSTAQNHRAITFS